MSWLQRHLLEGEGELGEHRVLSAEGTGFWQGVVWMAFPWSGLWTVGIIRTGGLQETTNQGGAKEGGKVPGGFVENCHRQLDHYP
jgi:hypothetical protein